MNTYQVMIKGFNWFKVEAVDQTNASNLAEQYLVDFGWEYAFPECSIVLYKNKAEGGAGIINAKVAKVIHKELKLAFPMVKFKL